MHVLTTAPSPLPTGKEGPSEELLEAFRAARLGCWDAEGGQIVSKLRQVLKAMRRRESRRRVRERVVVHAV